ncbi:cytochrome P450 [Deinococcus koreensis]|uniref:Cytochrome P450 n=1 Tax=Deinococcus koreensis TaxID=2054903 RepID=A0A2K3UW18_9DEIO|nr:cytochrome P450 [Deinococcus koreensis]PNY80722.1 cytochrome P450 [Deinococcus koreensis]
MTAPTALPPMPPAPPLLGHALPVMRDVLGFMTQVTRQYGDVARVRLGPREIWVVGHPRDIETLHLHTGRAFDKGLWRNPLLTRLLGRGLLISEGDFWLRQRRLAQPAFHSARVQGYLSVMQQQAHELAGQWQAGGVRDVNADLSALTMRIVMRSVMGVPEGSGRVDAISRSLDMALRGFQRDLGNPLPAALPTPARRLFGRGAAGLDEVMRAIIEERRAEGNPGSRDDLLDMLMSARDDDGQGMSDQQLLDEVKNILLAGHDTTASTLSFALAMLSQHPAQAAALDAELSGVLAGRAPELAELRQLPYLDAVIKETLRLYPAAWSTQREARESVQIGGFTAPPGTLFWINHWVTHRDPRFFTRPESFEPERWLGDLESRLPKYAYFPFGGGGRICIGRDFARLEAATVLAVLFQRFTFRMAGPLRLEPAVSLRPRQGLKMDVRPR